jgi:MoxR-like ATPase
MKNWGDFMNTRQEKLESLIKSVESVIVGKRKVIERIVTALISGGHVLLEDVPGVGKTKWSIP